MGSAAVSAASARGARAARALALAAVLMLLGGTATAHIQDFMARVAHVVARDGAVQVYLQLPLALVLLPQDWKAGGTQPAPAFLRRGEDGRLAVDSVALRRDTGLLRALLGEAVRLGGAYGELVGARIDTLEARDPFTYLPAVERSVGPGVMVPEGTALDLADAVVSLHLRFGLPAPGTAVTLSGSAREWPELSSRAVNIVRLHREDGSIGSSQSVGPLELALGPLEGSGVGAGQSAPGFGGYVEAGFRHVLAGLDHVLFIVVLLVGAVGPAHFLRSSLAFTLGHSITLFVGALGGLTTFAWFAPGVELAIAASIAWAALRVLSGHQRPLLVPAVLCVGLVHGFGFSFAIEATAQSLSGNFATLLLGFNLGIELGQLAISALAAPVLYLLRRSWRGSALACRRVLATPCIAIASFWLVERAAALVLALPH